MLGLVKWRPFVWNLNQSVFIRSKTTASAVPMNKMLKKYCIKRSLDKTDKRKLRPYFQIAHQNLTEGEVKRKSGPSPVQQKRATIISKTFYSHITQLINSGELSSYLAWTSVNITKLKVQPDLKTMNIYWATTGTEADIKTEQLLTQKAGKLRHLLINYLHMNSVPHITFVKDKVNTNPQAVEQILKTIDFGPDYEPTGLDPPLDEPKNMPHVQKHLQSLAVQFERSDVDKQAKSVSDKNRFLDACATKGTCATEHSDADLEQHNNNPELSVQLKNNIYGLDYNAIMNNLILKKSSYKIRPNIDVSSNIESLEKQMEIGTVRSDQYKKLAQELNKPPLKKVKSSKFLLREFEKEYIDSMYQDDGVHLDASTKDDLYNEQDSDSDELINDIGDNFETLKTDNDGVFDNAYFDSNEKDV